MTRTLKVAREMTSRGTSDARHTKAASECPQNQSAVNAQQPCRHVTAFYYEFVTFMTLSPKKVRRPWEVLKVGHIF
jgi:hypothetical protein